MARRARSLTQLLSEVDSLRPKRDKKSDGWIGDPAHRARVSDHNPNRQGVVQAQDITNDTGLGLWLWNFLLASKDPRIKYVIFNRQMFSSYSTSKYPAWTARPYSGANPHTLHIHVSVQDLASLYDDNRGWDLSVPKEDEVFAVRFGDSGEYVKRAQVVMNAASKRTSKFSVSLKTDGEYGPKTAEAVNQYAKGAGLPADGGTGMHVLVLDYCRNWLSDAGTR